VNDRMARRYWSKENPIGHRIATGDNKTRATVVGVVSDVHQYGLDKEPAETMYFPVDQAEMTNGHLLVRTRENPLRMAAQAVTIIHQIDPQQPVTEVRRLDQLRRAQLGTPRVTSMLLSKPNILRDVLTGGMIPVLMGLLFGAVVAAFATQTLAKMLFGIKPDDPPTFVAIAVVFLVVALIGCVIPARRAVKMDPMIALRTE
jgi:hypothetical protein